MANEQIVTYQAPPTVAKLLRSEARVNLIAGPVGSGKSVGCIMFMVKKAHEQPAGPDGIRRSRFVIVRNTQSQLRDTSFATLKEWLPIGVAGTWHEAKQMFVYQSGDTVCELIGRALDTPQDVGRLLSLEVTGGWLNEARELPQEIVEGLLGRVGRYNPNKLPQSERGWSGIVADTNFPMEDSYWKTQMENPPTNWKVFVQPGGEDPAAENVENLPPGYYADLRANNSEEWSRVYIDCNYGLGNAGKPVWRDFKKGIHVAPQVLTIPENIKEPFIAVGMDFGLTPACVFAYQTVTGQIQAIDEAFSMDMGIERFIPLKLKPVLRRYPSADYLVIGDPAGRNRAMTNEKSSFDMLKQAHIPAKEASTNALVPRIGAVENLLTRTIDGQPGLLISPRCTRLIQALSGGYLYKINRMGNMADTPSKNEYSHIADALQYMALYFEEGVKREKRRARQSFSGSPWRPADKTMGY